MRTTLALLLSITVTAALTACGGQITPDSTGDGDGQGTSSSRPSDSPAQSPSSPPSTPTPETSPGSEGSQPLPASSLSAAGACTGRKPTSMKVSTEGAPTCQVKNRITHPDGRVEIQLVTGDAGAATLVDGSVLLTCGTAGTLLFQAVLRCYAFDGDYTLESGDLILGAESSDRKCRLDVDDDGSHVSGFISCADDVGASDLFSSNEAPLSLGAFTLPRTW